MKVAKPSLSQPCDQSRQVRRSPNHWCAISCAIRASASASRRARASYSAVSVSVVALMFSMPPKMKSCTTTCEYLA